jgi:hypothetical protein
MHLRFAPSTITPHTALSPEVAINFGGHFLIRCVGSPDWWMGQRDRRTGDIHCWGTTDPTSVAPSELYDFGAGHASVREFSIHLDRWAASACVVVHD